MHKIFRWLLVAGLAGSIFLHTGLQNVSGQAPTQDERIYLPAISKPVSTTPAPTASPTPSPSVTPSPPPVGGIQLSVDASQPIHPFSNEMLGVALVNWEHSWGKYFPADVPRLADVF